MKWTDFTRSQHGQRTGRYANDLDLSPLTTAAALGMDAMGVIDRNSLAGSCAHGKPRKLRACGWSSAVASLFPTAFRSWHYFGTTGSKVRICALQWGHRFSIIGLVSA